MERSSVGWHLGCSREHHVAATAIAPSIFQRIAARRFQGFVCGVWSRSFDGRGRDNSKRRRGHLLSSSKVVRRKLYFHNLPDALRHIIRAVVGEECSGVFLVHATADRNDNSCLIPYFFSSEWYTAAVMVANGLSTSRITVPYHGQRWPGGHNANPTKATVAAIWRP